MNQDAAEGIARRAAAAAKWSLLSEFAAKALAPIAFLVLARLLAPEDFGVVAIATLVVSLSQVIADAGLSKALVQRERQDEDIHRVANVAFRANAILGVLIYLAIFGAAPAIAGFFDESRATAVIRVQGLQVILLSICSVPTALLQRSMGFKRLFWVRLCTTAVPALASIPLALGGMGIWALVIGMLVGSAAQSVALWSGSAWRPVRVFDGALFRDIVPFGLWSTAEGLLYWSLGWLDTVFVGRYLSTRELGLYQTGTSFSMLAFGLLLTPLLPIMFSSLSRLQYERAKMHAAFLSTTKLCGSVAIPIAAVLAAMGETITAVLFGAKWDGMGVVVACLGLSQGISWLAGMNPELYRASGRPGVNVLILGACLCMYVPVYAWAIKGGLDDFLPARVLVGCLGLFAHVFAVWWVADVAPPRLLRQIAWALLGGVVMFGAMRLGITRMGATTLPGLLGWAGVGALLYLAVLTPEMPFLRRTLRLAIARQSLD